MFNTIKYKLSLIENNYNTVCNRIENSENLLDYCLIIRELCSLLVDINSFISRDIRVFKSFLTNKEYHEIKNCAEELKNNINITLEAIVLLKKESDLSKKR